MNFNIHITIWKNGIFGKSDKMRKKWKSVLTETLTTDSKVIFRLYYKKTVSE